MDENQKLKRATYNLWIMVTSNFISSFGSQIYAFAISYSILHLTGSAVNFATNLFFSVIPRLIASPFAGYVTDRFSRKQIIVLSHLITIATILMLLGFSLTTGLTLPVIYAGTFIFSLVATFSDIGFSSSISGLIDEERIQRGISLNQMVDSIAAITSPMIGGILYVLVSISVFLVIYLVGTAIVTVLLLTMTFNLFTNTEFSEEEAKDRSMLASFKEGIAYGKRKPIIVCIISVAFMANFFVGSFQVGFSYILIDLLEVPSNHFGLVQGGFAAGMLVFSFYLSIRKEIRYPLIVTKYCLIVMAVAMAVFSLPLHTPFHYSIMIGYFVFLTFVLGGFIILINTPIGVMMQKTVDDAYKGRVFSIMSIGAQSLMPFSLILYGFLYDFLPATPILIISGLLLILATLYVIRPDIIKRAHPEYVAEKEME